MLKKISWIVLLMGCTFQGMSQYSATIVSSRPGQAFVPFTTGKNVLQVQSGVNYGQSSTALIGYDFQTVQQNTALRYGISERFEIRTDLTWNQEEFSISDYPISEISGFNFLNTGLRYNLLKGSGYGPSFGIQAHTRFDLQTEEEKLNQVTLELLHSQQLLQILSLTTNWSVKWLNSSDNLIGGYVVNLAFPIRGKLGGFVETYGDFVATDFNILFDGGFAYLLNPDLQLDVSGGFGGNDGLSSWFVDLGVSWRIRFTDKSSK